MGIGTSGKKARVWLVVGVLGVLMVILVGCGQSQADQAIKTTVAQFTKASMVKEFALAITYTTGAERDGVQAASQRMAQANYTDTAHHLVVTVLTVDTKNGTAAAQAKYDLEESVPGSGESWDQMIIRYDLVRINGNWLISSSTLVLKQPEKGGN